MKTAVSLVLAGALAVGTVSALPFDADASGRRQHHYHHKSAPFDPAAGLLAGAIVGLAVGGLAAPALYPPYDYYPPYDPYPPPYWVTGNPHMDWCQATYETYDPETNLWFDYRGAPHPCVGPY